MMGIEARLAYVWVGFNYLAYISVSTSIFQVIADCEDFDDGTSRLKADYRFECSTPTHDSPTYNGHYALAWIGVPLYVFGVPLVFFGLLQSSRDRESFHTAFLSDTYAPDRYFVEPLNCMQKVTVAGLLVFLEPSYAQLLYGIIVAFFWCVVFALLNPFPSSAQNIACTMINVCTVLILIGALSLKLDISEVEEDSLSLALTRALL
jgi:hypothetical protein